MAERVGLKLPRERRLRASADFARVRSNGRTFRGGLMTMNVADAAAEEPARLGVITSKRVGNAVVRNRVRRRLRELFRTNQPRILPGHWIVIIARAAAARATYEQLAAEWLRLAGRASILRA
jgi:ribonuclease P protein component